MRSGILATTLVLLYVSMMSSAHAQEGYGTVTFTVEVTGIHNRPTEEKGGYRNWQKSRIFRGTARVKNVGHGYAGAANTSRTDIWATQRCAGVLEVADKGKYRRTAPYEVGMREVPTSLTASFSLGEDAVGSDECSFNLTYDPTSQTASINVDPGPLRIEAVETTNISSVKTHINPFDWTALRQFEKSNIKVGGTRTNHSGSWIETMGEPIALDGATRVSGEVVETSTRISWSFTGQPSPPKKRKTYDEQDDRANTPPRTPPGSDDDLIAGCLKEQEEAGRARPDAVELMECVQKKADT